MSSTCAFPIMTSQNAGSEKDLLNSRKTKIAKVQGFGAFLCFHIIRYVILLVFVHHLGQTEVVDVTSGSGKL